MSPVNTRHDNRATGGLSAAITQQVPCEASNPNSPSGHLGGPPCGNVHWSHVAEGTVFQVEPGKTRMPQVLARRSISIVADKLHYQQCTSRNSAYTAENWSSNAMYFMNVPPHRLRWRLTLFTVFRDIGNKWQIALIRLASEKYSSFMFEYCFTSVRKLRVGKG